MTATAPLSIAKAVREAMAVLRKPQMSTYRQASVRAPQKAKRRALQRIDAIIRIPLFAPRGGMTMAFNTLGEHAELQHWDGQHTKLVERPARPAPDDARTTLARIEALGLTSIVSPKGRLTFASPGGKAEPGLLDVLGWQISPVEWLAAHRSGKPMPCDWCPAESITLLLGGVPACAAHAA